MVLFNHPKLQRTLTVNIKAGTQPNFRDEFPSSEVFSDTASSCHSISLVTSKRVGASKEARNKNHFAGRDTYPHVHTHGER